MKVGKAHGDNRQEVTFMAKKKEGKKKPAKKEERKEKEEKW